MTPLVTPPPPLSCRVAVNIQLLTHVSIHPLPQ
jgi:hypothetical protein